MKSPLSFKIALSALVATAWAVAAAPVSAQTEPWTDSGKNACQIDGVATIQGFQCLLGNVFSVALSGIGLAVFVMIIVAGYRYLVSGGNSKGTETARNTVTYAVIGIVVALSGYIILKLVSDFTGITQILNFSIPGEN